MVRVFFQACPFIRGGHRIGHREQMRLRIVARGFEMGGCMERRPPACAAPSLHSTHAGTTTAALEAVGRITPCAHKLLADSFLFPHLIPLPLPLPHSLPLHCSLTPSARRVLLPCCRAAACTRLCLHTSSASPSTQGESAGGDDIISWG